MCISLWIAWSWGSQRPPKQHSSFESVNLINLINKNQGSEIHVKTWQIREAEEQPRLLPTSLQFLQPKGVRSCLNLALPLTSIYSPPNLYTHQLVTVSIPDSKQVLFDRTQWIYYTTIMFLGYSQKPDSMPYYWWYYMFVHHSSFIYAPTMLKHAWSACLQWFSTCSFPGQS